MVTATFHQQDLLTSNHCTSPQRTQPHLAIWKMDTGPCSVRTPCAALSAVCPSNHRCHSGLRSSGPFLQSAKSQCHCGRVLSPPSNKSANHRSHVGLPRSSPLPPILPPRTASQTRSTRSLSVSQRERPPSIPCSRCVTSGGWPARRRSRRTRPTKPSSV